MAEPAAARSDGGGTVAIIGLGLIGGSLARDLSALGRRVLGYDRDAATLRSALAEGCIHALPDAHRAIEEADVVVIALPVGAAPPTVAELAPLLENAALITDVGSTKRSIVAAAEAAGLGVRFVGSHPLAGDHRSGWDASRPGLFRGAPCFLCPARGASDAAVERAAALWRSVGAVPQRISAAEHDARMAWASHLPQAAASALAAALAGSGYGADALGPGGRQATRLAESSPALWTDILLDNADQVEPALAALEAEVAQLRGCVRQRDAATLARLLSEAKAWKEG
ncbi:MAG TPA: prephenate dehydrogenase [Longimicrobiales bacterium]|nr:prephenate dehydrogenase [Longimicrobiales bacterium]